MFCVLIVIIYVCRIAAVSGGRQASGESSRMGEASEAVALTRRGHTTHQQTSAHQNRGKLYSEMRIGPLCMHFVLFWFKKSSV